MIPPSMRKFDAGLKTFEDHTELDIELHSFIPTK